MYISLNWIREYADLPKGLNPHEFGQLVTLRSAEVEEVVDQAQAYENMVIGEIKTLKKHPDADMLTLCQVDIGNEDVQVVCGGSNLKEGMKVAMGLPGAKVKWHGEEEMTLEARKVRGEVSHGMICAGSEIGLEDDPEDERAILDLSHLKDKAGTPLAKALELNDVILEFDNKSLTHRPDLWGHRGMARELATITGSNFKDYTPALTLKAGGESPQIDVEDPELCPRYTGLIIKNVKVGDSPDWLKRRLLATDHSIISNIVDVTNYVMEEIGQPLHAFDLRNIEGGIVVRRAKDGEEIVTLDGESKKLDSSMLVIADHKKPVALAGVMGGEHSGIQPDTVDILLESANFEPVSVRQSSVKLGLRTDAVQRFEKSLDPNQCELALLRAAELILELCPGAEIAGPMTDVANFDTSEPLVAVDTSRVISKIGIDIPVEEMANNLQRLGFELQGKVSEGAQQFMVKVPSWRATKDVDMEDDIIEEIARLYGYEKLPALVPQLPTRVPKPNHERRNKHEARDIFALALGFTEIYNYSFYNAKTIADFQLKEAEHLKIQNALSEDQSHLRTTLIPNLLKSIEEAAKHAESPKLFELGRVYFKDEFMPKELKRIAALMALPKNQPQPFTHIKAALEEFMNQFGVDFQIHAEDKPAAYMHPHQVAKVLVRGKTAGHIFTVHPQANPLEERVLGLELDFQKLSEARRKVLNFKEISKFPSIAFDISVLLDKKKPVADIEKALRKALPKLLQNVELFDSYEGDRIASDKKSLAFRLTLQAKDRTLTSADLEEAQKAAWSALEKLGGEIRGR